MAAYVICGLYSVSLSLRVSNIVFVVGITVGQSDRSRLDGERTYRRRARLRSQSSREASTRRGSKRARFERAGVVRARWRRGGEGWRPCRLSSYACVY